ncbi:alpha/beta hydrolase-fold protein [Sphingomonas sp.]|uniref:alpha/beta hydrolase n=1 Tax=Sphingomonas sp. TaxID=28214 RepID=UPI00184DAAD1|nr:alpha/beta hydrolase-fold protein [Sphingomonas sp.]MBA3512377.1 alpha/beta hydrolase [Sphingomonas sp.]
MSRLLAALAALALAGCVASPLPASGRIVPLNHLPALAGDYFPLHSRSNGHLYHIYVRLPEGYAAEPSRRYPIVYLLDGDSLFPVVGANHIFLTIDDKIPEAIVVGIAYGSFAKPINRRHIDFMPPGPEESGTAAFHRFLEAELLPAVEGRYRADPTKRILFGQSRAGAMILYSAFTRPDLFWARIASNPSWVPGREIFYGAPAPASRKDLQLFVALGTQEYPDRRVAAAEWFRYWRARNPPWKLTRIDIEGGTHSADAANAYRAALRRLFGFSTTK